MEFAQVVGVVDAVAHVMAACQRLACRRQPQGRDAGGSKSGSLLRQP